MSNVTFDLLWREAVLELLEVLETENPEDPTSRQGPQDWSSITSSMCRSFPSCRTRTTRWSTLEELDKKGLGRALDGCSKFGTGSTLNDKVDLVSFDSILVDLKLTAKTWRSIRCFVSERRRSWASARSSRTRCWTSTTWNPRPTPPGSSSPFRRRRSLRSSRPTARQAGQAEDQARGEAQETAGLRHRDAGQRQDHRPERGGHQDPVGGEGPIAKEGEAYGGEELIFIGTSQSPGTRTRTL